MATAAAAFAATALPPQFRAVPLAPARDDRPSNAPTGPASAAPRETPAPEAHFAEAAVHEVALGERVAVYGPAQGLPVCYQYVGGQDRFTLFKNAKDLVTVAPAGGVVAGRNPGPLPQGLR